MTRNEIVNTVKDAGYTHVLTAGGKVALDDWTPYGMTEHKAIAFTWYGDDRIREIALAGGHPSGFVTGVWTLS